jgi:hypothetical protein
MSKSSLESTLVRITDLLRLYRGQEIEEDIEAFARSEVSVEDPLQARLVGTREISDKESPLPGRSEKKDLP